MATKPASSEKSKTILPSISEDKLENNLRSPRDSKPKSSSKRRDLVNFADLEAAVSSEEQGRKAPGKKEAVTEESGKETLSSSNRRRIARRSSLQTGLLNCTDSNSEMAREGLKTPRRTSKKKIQLVKPPSPDIIDLSDERVVQELMIRLFETLRLAETETQGSASMEQKDWKMMNKTKDNEARLHTDFETTTKFHQNVIKFPKLSRSTSHLEVFYSKPLSWQCLKNGQTQRRKSRSTNYYAFRESFTKSYQDEERKEMYNHGQLSQMIWNCGFIAPISTSRTMLRNRGFSFPLLMRHSNAIVSPRLLKTAHESRKSVTFAV